VFSRFILFPPPPHPLTFAGQVFPAAPPLNPHFAVPVFFFFVFSLGPPFVNLPVGPDWTPCCRLMDPPLRQFPPSSFFLRIALASVFFPTPGGRISFLFFGCPPGFHSLVQLASSLRKLFFSFFDSPDSSWRIMTFFYVSQGCRTWNAFRCPPLGCYFLIPVFPFMLTGLGFHAFRRSRCYFPAVTRCLGSAFFRYFVFDAFFFFFVPLPAASPSGAFLRSVPVHCSCLVLSCFVFLCFCLPPPGDLDLILRRRTFWWEGLSSNPHPHQSLYRFCPLFPVRFVFSIGFLLMKIAFFPAVPYTI